MAFLDVRPKNVNVQERLFNDLFHTLCEIVSVSVAESDQNVKTTYRPSFDQVIRKYEFSSHGVLEADRGQRSLSSQFTPSF